jgi:hypothetical protein
MKKVFIAGIVLLAIFLIVLSFIPLGIEPLTEVYFENHTQLPAYILLGKPYNFSFTVHNLEYQKMKYLYTVDAFSEEDEYLYNMDKGEFELRMDEMGKIDETFKLVEDFNRTKIQVNITKDLSLERPKFKDKLWWPDPNYPISIDIHFWIEQVEGTSIIITNSTQD